MKQRNILANSASIVAERNLMCQPSPQALSSAAPWKVLLGRIRSRVRINGFLSGTAWGRRSLREGQRMGVNVGILESSADEYNGCSNERIRS